MNREIKRTERDGSVTRQFYDRDGQLVKVIRPNEYAGAGEDGKGVHAFNCNTKVETFNGNIQINRYEYDVWGNLTTCEAMS